MEDGRLSMFQNNVLRTIFEPKRDEETGEWKKLHNEELIDLQPSPNIIRVIIEKNEIGGACNTYGGEEVYSGFLWGNLRERPLGRPRRRCKDNIKMDLQEVGWAGVDWIDLAQDRNWWRELVNVAINAGVP
jgi:hypothetical protein